MNLKVNLEFYVKGPFFNRKVSDLAELKSAITSFRLTEASSITLTCYADVINTDTFVGTKRNWFSFLASPNGKEVASTTFVVSDKISTVADIRSYLNKKYKTTFDFQPEPNTENKPAMLDFVHENHGIGLRDEKTGRPTEYSLYSVAWHYLNDKDIIVNHELKQIWPHATDKIPAIIQDFFKVNVR